MIFLLYFSCTTGSKTTDSKTTDSAIAEPIYTGILSKEDGWLRGDLHIHSTYSDGYDDVVTNIAIAEYLSSEEFIAAHPKYKNNGLDFISLTDHRTIEQQLDTGYESNSLILIDGQEFGSRGHAGTHGVQEKVEHDPDGDGVTLDDILQAVFDTHNQNGSFSPNHPFLPRNPFPWDINTHDGIEVWNSGWALMSPEMTYEKLSEWENENDTAGASYKRAVQTTGQLASMQILTWYEALLSRGIHTALIGGSDRHLVLPIGFPTTWIHTAEASQTGVIEGIKNRRTFVSRTPISAQVDMEVEIEGNIFYMGETIPISSSGTQATIRIRVGRAQGGLLLVRYGSSVESDDDLALAPLGDWIREENIRQEDFILEWNQTVSIGDWFFPMILDPLVLPGTSEEETNRIKQMAQAVAQTGSEDFLELATLFSSMADNEVLFDGSECRIRDWNENGFHCLPPDNEGFASFFVPDKLDRALNVFVENDRITDWSMGAIGSAVLFKGME
jgi:hypothetical protein